MATQLSSCSSSSSTTLSPSSIYKQNTQFSRKCVNVPIRTCLCKWVTQICSRRKDFELKFSNGLPPTAVSLQNGESIYLLYLVHLLDVCRIVIFLLIMVMFVVLLYVYFLFVKMCMQSTCVSLLLLC